VTERLFVGLAFAAIGLVTILNRDTQARNTVKFQNRWFRQWQGEREIKINRWVYLVVGVGFIGFGLSYAFGGL
jgi:hypothetical protein